MADGGGVSADRRWARWSMTLRASADASPANAIIMAKLQIIATNGTVSWLNSGRLAVAINAPNMDATGTPAPIAVIAPGPGNGIESVEGTPALIAAMRSRWR